MSGFVVWFTGLSGAGKSTLAAMLASAMRLRGVHVEVLDGDEVRTHLSKGLGFSREDRDTNVRRIGFVAKLVARSGACAITAAISPYRAIRDEQRAQIERFVEVYCCASVDSLAARDPKGLYRKALAGEIKGFSGIDDPYEAPSEPEITVYTDRETKEESLSRIIERLEELGYVPRGRCSIKTNYSTKNAKAARSPLPSPHGGQLLPRAMTGELRDRLTQRALSLPVIDLPAEAESFVDLFATGALSPLKGFVGEKDFLRIAREMRLENGLPWPLPVTLPIRDDVTKSVRIGAEAALRARDGRIVAVIEVSDVYRPPTADALSGPLSALGATDPDLAQSLPRGLVLVGGEVFVLDSIARQDRLLHDEPKATRSIFEARGLRAVAGMRTSAVPTRAEEHWAKVALEITGGLWIQALYEGEARPNAVDLPLRLRCHDALIERYFPASRVILSAGLEAPPFEAGAGAGAGARHAVLSAIICQNHGCSHAIIGGSLGSSSVTDAERAFRVYAPGELEVVPLCFENAFHSTRTSSIATTRSAPGDASTWIIATQMEILEALGRGEKLPPEIIRPEVVEILLENAAPR